jgi:hypothetical protein
MPRIGSNTEYVNETTLVDYKFVSKILNGKINLPFRD